MTTGESCLIAIDPGLTGAVALYDNDGLLTQVFDMPVLADRPGGKKSVDVDELVDSLPHRGHVVIEAQQAMPKQGLSSTFQTGLNYGAIIGAIKALSYSHTIVSPSEWARKVGKPKGTGKDWNIAAARRLFPNAKPVLTRSKDGRADAILIGAAYLDLIPPPDLTPEEPAPVKEDIDDYSDW